MSSNMNNGSGLQKTLTRLVDGISNFVDKFLVLRGAMRELWVIFASKIMTILAYSLVNSVLILWLSKNLNFGDVGAGAAVAVWSTALTIFTIMVGSLVDAVGIKKSLIAGFGIATFARLIMSVCAVRWIALPFGLFPLALGEALQTPVMVAAVRRFTNTKQRSIAFSIYYSMMNVGFAIGGYMVDKIRLAIGDAGHITLPLIGLEVGTYQAIIFLGMLFTLPNLLLAIFAIRNGAEAAEDGTVKITPEVSKYPDNTAFEAAILSFRDALKEWAKIFGSLWKDSQFYRFLAFFALVVFVKLILYNMYYLFPKYAMRELGDNVPFGQLFGTLNAVIVIVFAPIVGALTQKFSAYKTVVIGSAIAALSVFLIALPQTWYAPMARSGFGDFIANTWLGMNIAVENINPLYVAIVLFTTIYSIGECFYSPRLYEYPASIAPKGQEGSYLALSMLPYFIAKFFAGTLSGLLLAKFCPESGPRNSSMMWIIIGSMALLTPIGLMIAKPFIKVHESGRDD